MVSLIGPWKEVKLTEAKVSRIINTGWITMRQLNNREENEAKY